MNYPGDLLDYFAAMASEADIALELPNVAKEHYVVDGGFGRKEIAYRVPANARQQARYRHAQKMLSARPRIVPKD